MNENGLTYRLFTISEIERWLFHNVENGLSDKVISRPRALAFVRNPHAKPDDPALVVVYNDKNVPVGYTGAFAEQWMRPALSERYFWGSTQWMDSQYRGKGVSGKMMRMIKDAVGDRYVALDSSPASCRLDEKQGSVISYYTRYYFVFRGDNIKFRAAILQNSVARSNRKVLNDVVSYAFSNRHVNWIDDNTYSFIVAHSNKDLFLRGQDYLNWQVWNPFLIAAGSDPNIEREKCEFGGVVKQLETEMIQVRVDGILCAFYILHTVNHVCTLLYLYLDDAYRDQVFASVTSVVLHKRNLMRFRTFHKELFDFMINLGVRSMFSKHHTEQIALTVPGGFVVDPSLQIQGGDGDMVC